MRRRTFLSAAVGGVVGLLPGSRAFAGPDFDEARRQAKGEKAIIYSPSKQRVAIVTAKSALIKSYFVSGKYGIPRPGRYRVYSKSPTAFSSKNPDIQWKYMIRFTKSANGNPIGFHQIPVRCKNGKCYPLQGPGQVGTALSAGCVRQTAKQAKWLYAWADVGTLVIVTK